MGIDNQLVMYYKNKYMKKIWPFRIFFGPLYRKIFINNKTLWCIGQPNKCYEQKTK
jgi:hypothetical protein